VGDGRVEVYPGNYEDYRWRKEGGAEKLQETVSRSTIIAHPVNGNQSQGATASDKSKRLNPIKRKQLEERVQELEAEISRAETEIADCEAALQTFVSADQTARQTQELSSLRSQLQEFLSEWEDLAHALEA
jgi:ATP-binding cassette subfamily F protein 3